jgi:hypothetical protein
MSVNYRNLSVDFQIQSVSHRRTWAETTRPGVAPIEFLMIVPVIVGFTAVMLWMARVQNRSIQVGIIAEVTAAEQSVVMTQKSTLPASGELGYLADAGELQQLVSAFFPGLSVTKGAIHGTGSLDTGEGVNNLIQPIGMVHDEHWLMSHSFESEVFAFPQNPSDQPALTFPASIQGIAPQISDLGLFRNLLQFSGKRHSINLANVNSLIKDVDEAKRQIQEAIQRIRSEIKSLEERIRRLREQIPPDWGAIRNLQRELDQKRKQEQRLLDGLRHAGHVRSN